MKISLLPILIIFHHTVLTAPKSCGESIGINFTGGTAFLQPADEPGIVGGGNWKNVSGGSQMNVALHNSSGLPLSTRLSYTSARESTGYGTTDTSNAATNKLYSGDLTGNNISGEVIVNISNIPYAHYDIYVFASQAYTTRTLSITDGLTTFYYRGDGQPLDGATNLTETTSEDPNNPTVGRAHYQVFRNRTSSSFSISTGGSISGIVSNNVFGLHIVRTGYEGAPVLVQGAVAPPDLSGQFPITFGTRINELAQFSFDVWTPPSTAELAIEVSNDFISWRHLATVAVSTPATRITDTLNLTSQRFYRSRVPNPTTKPTLSWPLPSRSPYTARCVAIMDHDPVTGRVLAYNGELGDSNSVIDQGVTGYAKADGSPFVLALLAGYQDHQPSTSANTHLFYDNHRGYDYPATQGTKIYAAASGRLFVATDVTAPNETGIWRNPVAGPRFQAIDYSWNTYHTFYVVHAGGLSTWYLHASSLAADLQTRIRTDGYADVVRGDVIAHTGDKGATGSFHLHFAVRESTGIATGGEITSSLVDPYGSSDTDFTDVLWDTRPPNE